MGFHGNSVECASIGVQRRQAKVTWFINKEDKHIWQEEAHCLGGIDYTVSGRIAQGTKTTPTVSCIKSNVTLALK